MSWRESLATLRKQFEAQGLRSRGLHHLMVEVADDERDRMGGPDWFTREGGFGAHDGNPWRIIQSSGLPWVHPRFREIRIGEPLEGISEERIRRDGSGQPRAVFEPMRLRESFLCGDLTVSHGFQSFAKAASNVLTELRELWETDLEDELADLFHHPRGGIRYVFGEVADPPTVFLNCGWQGGGLVYSNGLLIDVPIAESQPDEAHWMLLLHRLAWRRFPGSPLQGIRLAWHANMTVPYEWISQKQFDSTMPSQWRVRFAQIPTTSYYSVLGDREHPLDVNLASAFAIDLLLSAKSKAQAKHIPATPSVDYSKETWKVLPMPSVKSSCRSAHEVKAEVMPKLVLFTATAVERDTVIKHLSVASESDGIIRVFHENNTYFIGLLGNCPIALCMSSMGGSGRDSIQTVCGEAIRFWEPKGVIMVGIAFGRSRERQRIGDVLISERIIAYEPQRVGKESSISRGMQFQPGIRLFNRFRNADTDWCFQDPTGASCTPHFGPVLSGEKLIDDPEFKSTLFQAHPNAIGGEMEGVGLASTADREKCEWLLVKGICDWADGNKTDGHQGFAAASAVSFVKHVLSQPNVV